MLLSDAISCDFIDAAVLAAALLQKLDSEKFTSISAHALQSMGGMSVGRLGDRGINDVSMVRLVRKSFDDVNDDINRYRDSSGEEHATLPVFIFCMRAIMRCAKDQYALHSRSISRGSSCRSTPSSSPLKQSHHFPCRIDMRPYAVSNTDYDNVGYSTRLSSPRPYSSSSPSSGKIMMEFRELENGSYNMNGSPNSICNEEHSVSSSTRGFAFALRKHSISKALTPSPVVASSPRFLTFSDTQHHSAERSPRHTHSNLNSTHWVLVPSLMDPTTDLSKGILRVESSATATHRWLCESLAPLLPCLGKIISCHVV